MLASTSCLPCHPGHHQPEPGSIACVPCSAGEYQPSTAAEGCKRCDLGQYSLNGSSACSICARGYYRTHADSPTTECSVCDTVRGVRCGSNSTTATLELKRGYWRHSTTTTTTYTCKADGPWTPCAGGLDTGDEGDGYCAEGYRGP
eukprot:7386260-Prymnesium_polylepis.1